MLIGATISGERTQRFFPGSIDDVRIFDRVVTSPQAEQLYHQAPQVKARWQFDELSSRASSDQPAVLADTVFTPDSSTFDNDLYLWGESGLSTGFVDTSSMYMDGGGSYAYSPDVPIDTSLSFTVSGFARAASPSSDAASILSAVGQKESAFVIRFVPDGDHDEGWGRWEATLADEDSSEASVTRIEHQRLYDMREWHHLALVYNGFTAEAKLYVNGELEQVTCALGSEDGSCTEGASWADTVFPFEAGNTLHVGRSKSGGVWRESWPGAVDDVWVVQGMLSDGQIRQLSLGLRGAPTSVPSASDE